MDAPQSAAHEVVAEWFENSYECSECGAAWTDEWSCMCNDRCPECNVETQPTSSVDLSRAITKKDYTGATHLLGTLAGAALAHATQQDAKDYAQAMLEGGEYRFLEGREAY